MSNFTENIKQLSTGKKNGMRGIPTVSGFFGSLDNFKRTKIGNMVNWLSNFFANSNFISTIRC